ncbi:MAG: DUF362 domain-containing protein [Gemmatimonadota bacterium]|nr:DUF362 domain-containing protein [Gemmatimonadota bacterium]MDH3367518.1 DUF362 domain-containing protein [Gemmatimonadota bacterium]MDH3478730.1 DUF362 domain-containing protein [Gemmatimonadota bacterium]MDH5549592.1 DUF362 domain-containing protein [Gemmatimonadota bacterium]
MRGPTERLNVTGNITRREFAVGSACAVGSLAAGACLGTTAPGEPTARVAAVRGANLATMTRDVLDGLGGIGTVVGEGETVFIKPNMVTLPGAVQSNPFASGECTKPEIVVAVAEECLKAGAAEVVIGDGSHQPVLRWDLATTLDGSTNLAQEAVRLTAAYGRPVRVASLEVDSPAWVEVPSGTYLGTIAVSSLVANADRVISIPVAKTHSWAQLTLALKNFIGVTPFTRYGEFVNGYWDRGKEFDHSSTAAIAAIYLDIVKGIRPDLAIVDFSIGVEGDGPTLGHGGHRVDMKERLGSWLLIASTDLVAADATAARIMSHDPARMTQLRMGYEMGLGEIRGERIELVGERLEDLRVAWTPAQLRNRLASSPGGCPVFGPMGCGRNV